MGNAPSTRRSIPADSPARDFGNAFLKLSTTETLRETDYFEEANQAFENTA